MYEIRVKMLYFVKNRKMVVMNIWGIEDKRIINPPFSGPAGKTTNSILSKTGGEVTVCEIEIYAEYTERKIWPRTKIRH